MNRQRAPLRPLATDRPRRIAMKRAPGVRGVDTALGLNGPGAALDPGTRAALEPRFGHDLSGVRVHADRAADLSARAMGAVAFASSHRIGLAATRYDPSSHAGRMLLAHELAHVVQQTGSETRGSGSDADLETEADHAAEAVSRGENVPPLSAAAPAIQRRVEMRDVGRGEQSGFGRLQELIDRLNSISTALIFDVGTDGALTYTENPYGTETDFDRKMKTFIDAAAILPLRLTNRQGLLRRGDTGPFNSRVDGDAWASGYVDVDDMLASDDLGFQIVFVHFLTERLRTHLYARRIGSTLDDTSPEFTRTHNLGVAAEVELLRDFFGDPTIRLLGDGGAGDVFRRYRNRRGDTIRARTPHRPGAANRGLDPNLMDVRLRNGTIMTVDDYRELLRTEREAAAAPAAADVP